MRTKIASLILSFLALAGSVFAQQVRTFDLAWSSDTPFLRSLATQSVDTDMLGKDFSGRPYVSKASAKGQITIDLSKLQPGSSAIPKDAIVSFTMVVSGASTGSGYFYAEDVQDHCLDLGGAQALDFTRELVGQSLPNGGKWGVLDDINTIVPCGDFGLNAVEGNLAPVTTEFPFVLRTGGLSASEDIRYSYLQLVSFKPAEQPATETSAESPAASEAASN